MSDQTERETRYATAIHDATCSGEEGCYGDDETELAQARAAIALADQERAQALREAAAVDHEEHATEIALGGIDYVRDWLRYLANRIEGTS